VLYQPQLVMANIYRVGDIYVSGLRVEGFKQKAEKLRIKKKLEHEKQKKLGLSRLQIGGFQSPFPDPITDGSKL
jgi:hypothetical protein